MSQIFYRRLFIILFGLFVSASSGAAQVSTPVNRNAVLDFDGDGKTDIAVARYNNQFEPFRYTWFVRSSQNGQMIQPLTFGANGFGDVPVLADYDGDRKTDIAVFRKGFQGPSGNPANFYIWQSLTNSPLTVRWGLDSDNPYLTQDFDGDGKADPTIVRCFVATSPTTFLSQMMWAVLESRNNYQTYRIETFGACDGQRQDRPIRGDFDGDGRADLAFYRKFELDADGQAVSANRFYVKLSSKQGKILKVRFDYAQGGFTVPVDFDGDGKTDIAATRYEGVGDVSYRWWYWIRSSDGQLAATQFGYRSQGLNLSDLPVVGDYDGDGKTDLAVFRDSGLLTNQTYFYIQGSKHGFMSQQWGVRNFDIPLAYTQFIYVNSE